MRGRPDSDRSRLWLRRAVGAVAAMIVGGFLVGSYVAVRYEARLGEMAREMARTRERLAQETARFKVRAAAYDEIVNLLREPSTQVIPLQPAGPIPSASGRLVWNERTGGHLFVAALPPAPEGKAYEAWTISGGQPRPAGVFQPDASGVAVHRLDGTAGRVDVFAVTIEPAGESRAHRPDRPRVGEVDPREISA